MQKFILIIISIFLFSCQLKSQKNSSSKIYLRVGTSLIKEVGVWYETPSSKMLLSLGYIHGAGVLGSVCRENYSLKNVQNYLRKGITGRVGFRIKKHNRLSYKTLFMFRRQFAENLEYSVGNVTPCISVKEAHVSIQDTKKNSGAIMFFMDYNFPKRPMGLYLGLGFGSATTHVTTTEKRYSSLAWGNNIQTGLNEKSKFSNGFGLFDFGIKIDLIGK